MNRIKELRNKRDISQQDLADFFNISQQTISAYENGSREPDLDTLKKMSEYFNVTIDYLLGLPDKMIKIIPILGKIRAGLPLLASENWEAEVEVAADINADFALRIIGDSMSWVGIHDGDLAILRQASTAYNGDIIACGVQDGDWCATLKYFIKENGTPVLRAANPNYADMPITPSHRIIGTLVSIQKEAPSINTYKNFLNAKELSDEHWNNVIEKAVQIGLDDKQVIKLMELFSDMVKNIK
jgi:repressor LexA